jgi:hypothetical protein
VHFVVLQMHAGTGWIFFDSLLVVAAVQSSENCENSGGIDSSDAICECGIGPMNAVGITAADACPFACQTGCALSYDDCCEWTPSPPFMHYVSLTSFSFFL